MKYLFLLPTLVFAARVIAFASHGSLAGLSERELEAIVPTFEVREPVPPPGPLEDTSAKLVNDKAHPWKPLRRGDMRGPCPGLNTLASHGYLPRNGVATPAQIVTAVQEGFNLRNGAAIFATYAAHLVVGNLLTDLLSIGGKTPLTGPSPPLPATAGGLSEHGLFEGDASMTRSDAFLGSNDAFNETLFEQFVEYSNRFGGGSYNLATAAELRFKRIQDGIETNPQFSLVGLRYFSAYGESVAPINFFVDGWIWRPHADFSNSAPGRNTGQVNSYTFDPTSADFSDTCLLYENFVNKTVKELYPSPQGRLRKALLMNLDFFWRGVNITSGCAQVFPYGRD
ncbi:heme-thiolate peroxidase [Agrocybe chaxingu]|uniref:Heme-thiolate peroxidase n=1 Tax=Agrocybe chaxingu TaxID=84603 RepID=A0A9W8MZX0_9AGAR|nr:heme-thiolate peroxidase [Agrocybe chaxingu]